jgi:hypothetical protein
MKIMDYSMFSKSKMSLIGFLGTNALLLIGCAMAPVYVSKLNLDYSAPLVANKSNMPCFIVLDPTKVPDSLISPQEIIKETKIYEIRTFVERDIKIFFANYFNSVQVVNDKSSLPKSNYIVVDIAIKSLRPEANQISTFSGLRNATSTQAFGAMDWSVALRRDSDIDYIFSFSEKVIGTFPCTTVEQTPQMYKSAFESAVNSLAKKYQESNVQKMLY